LLVCRKKGGTVLRKYKKSAKKNWRCFVGGRGLSPIAQRLESVL